MGNSSSNANPKPTSSSWFSSTKPAETQTTPSSSFFGTAPATTTPATPSSSLFGSTKPAETTPATTSLFSGFSTGGRTRRKKRSTKKNKTKGKINFSKIKWGSFTKIYNNYIKNHPNMMNQLPDLKHFAHYVNKHPTQFTKKTHKKALFYTNIIEK